MTQPLSDGESQDPTLVEYDWNERTELALLTYEWQDGGQTTIQSHQPFNPQFTPFEVALIRQEYFCDMAEEYKRRQ